MPDYAKCRNIQCNRRKRCARYMMIPDKYWQTYALFNADNASKCNHFISLKNAPFECYKDISIADKVIKGVNDNIG